MQYRVVIRFRDKDKNTKEKSVLIPAQSKRDAELQRHFIQETEEKRHGKANVISVDLLKE